MTQLQRAAEKYNFEMHYLIGIILKWIALYQMY